jgi:hypothetical protein
MSKLCGYGMPFHKSATCKKDHSRDDERQGSNAHTQPQISVVAYETN